MKYNTKKYEFGDFMEAVVSNQYFVLFIGINDQLSSKAWSEFYQFLENKNLASLSLNYDMNKSLMLDLNVKRIPLVQFYMNGNLIEEVYAPKLKKEELEKIYEKYYNTN